MFEAMASSFKDNIFTISSSSDDSCDEIRESAANSWKENTFKCTIKNDDENEIMEVTESCNNEKTNISSLTEFVSKKSTPTRKRLPIHTMSDSEESTNSVHSSNSHSGSISPIATTSMLSLSSSIFANEPSGICLSNIVRAAESSSTTQLSYLKKSSLEKKKQKTSVTRVRDIDKAEKALARLKERERKQQEKTLAKALKDFEKEAKRCEKPEESIKLMKLSIDDSLKDELGFQHVFNILIESGISYCIEKNHIPSSILWYRHISEAIIKDNRLERNERDELENIMLIYIPSTLFIDLVYSSIQKRKGSLTAEQSLLDYLTYIKTIFPKMEITIITVELQNFLKGKRGNSKRDNEDLPITKPKGKNVSKKDVEEVLIEVQLQMFLNYQALESFADFGNLLLKYTKAVAEAPLKKEKFRQQEQFSWYAQADSNCPIKISKNGEGFVELWQQQMQQFNLVTKDIAQAIASKYPSPSLLIEAYKKCESVKKAENLLEDIIVRRDYGPLGTTRRVGPQLSYKMYRFFTSTNANELLQR